MKTFFYSLVTTSLILGGTALNAGDVDVDGSVYPTIYFDSTGNGDGWDWLIQVGTSTTYGLMFWNNVTLYNKLVFNIINSDNNPNSFIVDSAGDINLADGSVWIDRSANHVGIGTTTPEEELEIESSSPRITFDGTYKWHVGQATNSSWFWIHNDTDDRNPFNIHHDAPHDLVNLREAGIGVGTASPTAMLDVIGDAKFSFSGETTTANGYKSLAVLSNNNTNDALISDGGFQVENFRENFRWNFRTAQAYDQGFMITKEGSGGPEAVFKNGTNSHVNVEVAFGDVTVFKNGALQVASSRKFKDDIEDLDAQSALEAFHQLKPVSYVYKAHKDEPVIGFIAEDVPDLVATKDRDGISAMEVAALLTKVVQEQEKRNSDAVRSLNDAVALEKGKVRSLEARIQRLESILATFTSLDHMHTPQESLSSR